MSKISKGKFKIIRLTDCYYVMINKNVNEELSDYVGCTLSSYYTLNVDNILNNSYGIPSENSSIYFYSGLPANVIVNKFEQKVKSINVDEEHIPSVEYSDFRKYMKEHNKEKLILFLRKGMSMFTITEEDKLVRIRDKNEIYKNLENSKALVLNV